MEYVNYEENDFYVGQEVDDKLIPVDESLLSNFETIFEELVTKVIESKRDK